MNHVTITRWSIPEMTDEMIASAQEKYVPLILSQGASSVQMVRSGDKTFTVITQYPDAAAAEAANANSDSSRNQARAEFSMEIETTETGEVFGSG
jgi:hypothetical protein